MCFFFFFINKILKSFINQIKHYKNVCAGYENIYSLNVAKSSQKVWYPCVKVLSLITPEKNIKLAGDNLYFINKGVDFYACT